ncbi:Galactose-1-phosphate uridylyltransferase [Curvularia clavata]|uniref:Galactose-1-phosphate uridylyltransferase n=1 Tax=Curvularia clavata TaxID=95742 RepID=A0A9Q8Z261_CURCL|nr:Galactose-1-phosphate uridylyltransferase [Curvularia clavata]
MVSAKYSEVYQKIRDMGDKLKAAGKQGPSNDEQLKLYAYAKVAEGKSIDEAKQPGMFDLAGKAKHKEWKKVAESGITAEQAEQEYIKLAEELLAKYDN